MITDYAFLFYVFTIKFVSSPIHLLTLYFFRSKIPILLLTATHCCALKASSIAEIYTLRYLATQTGKFRKKKQSEITVLAQLPYPDLHYKA